MRIKGLNFTCNLNKCSTLLCSIHVVHDKVKDKDFKLELTWVTLDTDGLHQRVPQETYEAANKYGEESVNDDDD